MRKIHEETAAWLVRLSSESGAQKEALEGGFATLPCSVRGEADDFLDLTDIHAALGCDATREDEHRGAMLYKLLHDIPAGDLIVSPIAGKKQVAIGTVCASHCRDQFGRPARVIDWLATALPRSALSGDIAASLSGGPALSRIDRPDIVQRLKNLAASGKDHGPSYHQTLSEPTGDLEEILNARLLERMGAVFFDHALADLVAALLEVQGLSVKVSPPGPDGGIDIFAGSGPLGMSEPLVVQVKSGHQISGIDVLQRLEGAMRAHRQAQGLLVSWSGFSRDVGRRRRELWYDVRLWDARDILDAYVQNYESLPRAIRDRLPLKAIWTCAT